MSYDSSNLYAPRPHTSGSTGNSNGSGNIAQERPSMYDSLYISEDSPVFSMKTSVGSSGDCVDGFINQVLVGISSVGDELAELGESALNAVENGAENLGQIGDTLKGSNFLVTLCNLFRIPFH